MKAFDDKRPLYGQDPYVTIVWGIPVLCESKDEERIVLSFLDGLENPQRMSSVVVWDDHSERQVWAPELHFIKGLWYIYYSACDGHNGNHRNYVLQSPSPVGPYIKLGQVCPDIWGIDLTQFSWWDGNEYAVWSGWEKNGAEFPQNLYIAMMNSPWSVREPVCLAIPEFEWEKSISPILEAPQVWIRNGQLRILYSANASWKQEYSTGLLTMVGNNPLNPRHWVKDPIPVATNAGHGCVVDNYFIYHRKLSAFPGWADREIVSRKLE